MGLLRRLTQVLEDGETLTELSARLEEYIDDVLDGRAWKHVERYIRATQINWELPKSKTPILSLKCQTILDKVECELSILSAKTPPTPGIPWKCYTGWTKIYSEHISLGECSVKINKLTFNVLARELPRLIVRAISYVQRESAKFSDIADILKDATKRVENFLKRAYPRLSVKVSWENPLASLVIVEKGSASILTVDLNPRSTIISLFASSGPYVDPTPLKNDGKDIIKKVRGIEEVSHDEKYDMFVISWKDPEAILKGIVPVLKSIVK